MAPTLPSFLASGSHAAAAITISSGSESATNNKVTIVLSSSSPAVSVRPVLAPASTAGDGDDEATSRRRRKARYRRWIVDDELKVVATIAELRKANLGQQPQASCVFKALLSGRALQRRGVDVMELSQKMYHLRNKFEKAVAKAAANGGRRIRSKRNRKLYKKSKEAWPHLLKLENGAAADDDDTNAADDAAVQNQASDVRRRVRF